MSSENNNEILVVQSKLKNYIKAAADMNTSGNVAPMLSQLVRGLCDQAIENAKAAGRKTVMDRDFEGITTVQQQEAA